MLLEQKHFVSLHSPNVAWTKTFYIPRLTKCCLDQKKHFISLYNPNFAWIKILYISGVAKCFFGQKHFMYPNLLNFTYIPWLTKLGQKRFTFLDQLNVSWTTIYIRRLTKCFLDQKKRIISLNLLNVIGPPPFPPQKKPLHIPGLAKCYLNKTHFIPLDLLNIAYTKTPWFTKCCTQKKKHFISLDSLNVAWTKKKKEKKNTLYP